MDKLIILTGMHRSGTSVLSEIFIKLGFCFGKIEDEIPINEDNKKGFWERKDVVKLNDEILNYLNSSWQFIDEQLNEIEDIKDYRIERDLTRTIKTLYENDVQFIKDPRICLTLPIWKKGIKNPIIIFINRNPAEIAESLEKRNGFPLHQSFQLWTVYIKRLFEYAESENVHIISYENLVNFPEKEINELLSFLKNKNCDPPREINKELIKTLSSLLVKKEKKAGSFEFLENDQVIKSLYLALEDKNLYEVNQILNSKDFQNKSINYNWNLLKKDIPGVFPRITSSLYILDPVTHVIRDTERIINYIERGNLHLSFQIKNYQIIKTKAFNLQLDLIDGPSIVRIKQITLIYADKSTKAIEEFNVNGSKVNHGWIFFLERRSNLNLGDYVLEDISTITIDFFVGTHGFDTLFQLDNLFRYNREQTYKEIQSLSDKLQNNQRNITNQFFSEKKKVEYLSNIYTESQFALNAVIHSFSFRIGRVITSPFRLVRDQFKKLFVQNQIVKNEEISSKLEVINDTHWETEIKKEHTPSDINILYLSPNLPDYDSSSGGRRAFEILKLLAEDFHVLCYALGGKTEKYIQSLEKQRIKVLSNDEFKNINMLYPELDVIIFAWYYTYYQFHHLKDLYPNARYIADSVDVHWVREFRSFGIWESLDMEQALENKKKELHVYNQCDEIWVVTKEDSLAVEKENCQSKISVISNIHHSKNLEYRDDQTNNILFFGGYNHYPNISAALKLAYEIFPEVLKVNPFAKLIIAGSNAPEDIVDLGLLDYVDFKGFIPEDEMDALYEDTFMVAAPLLTGAGIKGKICEAVMYMKPVLTTDIGNEGINLIHEEDALIAEDSEFAQLIIHSLDRKYDFEKITKKAQEKVLKLVSPLVVKENIFQSIFPAVSICIVTYNKIELLKQCIVSILENTKYPNFKILIHSNGCTDGTQEYLDTLAEKYPFIYCFNSPVNEVFVIPNNKLMSFFPGNDVVLVNNDVTVTKGWLLNLVKAVYKSKQYGIAGSKIIYPDGRLQEFGSFLYEDGFGYNFGKGDDPSKPEYNMITKVGYVSGCAMYIKRSTIDQAGYFDEIFHPCYYEDSDFCYSAKSLGLETIVVPESVVYHVEGATAGTDISNGFKKYQEINRLKWVDKREGKKITKKNKTFEKVYWNGIELNIFKSKINYENWIREVETIEEDLIDQKQLKELSNMEDILYNGINPFSKCETKYLIKHTSGNSSSFRENVFCLFNHLNCRQRASAIVVEYIASLVSPMPMIYLTEQYTSFYNLLNTKFINLVSSDFVDEETALIKNIRREDLTKLSFENSNFDIVVSLEVLEHIPDYKKAIQEISRVLKPGGFFIFTVPFLLNQDETLIRAVILPDGNIKHLKDPEYHGDPNSDKGILCFYHFGWDLIQKEMKEFGFETEVIFLRSKPFGILGKNIYVFVSNKLN